MVSTVSCFIETVKGTHGSASQPMIGSAQVFLGLTLGLCTLGLDLSLSLPHFMVKPTYVIL